MNPTSLKEMRQAAKTANELSSKATEGPWKCIEDCLVENDNTEVGDTFTNHDAEFIASSRTAVPELADTVTQLCDEVERLREALEYITVYDSGKEGVPALDTFSANPLTIGFLKRDLKIIRTALKESNERLRE